MPSLRRRSVLYLPAAYREFVPALAVSCYHPSALPSSGCSMLRLGDAVYRQLFGFLSGMRSPCSFSFWDVAWFYIFHAYAPVSCLCEHWHSASAARSVGCIAVCGGGRLCFAGGLLPAGGRTTFPTVPFPSRRCFFCPAGSSRCTLTPHSSYGLQPPPAGVLPTCGGWQTNLRMGYWAAGSIWTRERRILALCGRTYGSDGTVCLALRG